MATRAESLRILVAEYDAEGVSPATIGARLGISVARVEEILDQLDESDGRPAHPDDEQRAPAVEPVRPPPDAPAATVLADKASPPPCCGPSRRRSRSHVAHR